MLCCVAAGKASVASRACVHRKAGSVCRQAGLLAVYSSENGSAELRMLVREGDSGVFTVALADPLRDIHRFFLL